MSFCRSIGQQYLFMAVFGIGISRVNLRIVRRRVLTSVAKFASNQKRDVEVRKLLSGAAGVWSLFGNAS